MVVVKQTLSKKDRDKVLNIMGEIPDLYGDFFITRDNIRLFLRDNSDLLFSCLRKGDKIAFNDKAIAFLTGYSDNANRKYFKVLFEEENELDKVIKAFLWSIKEKVWVKVKKNSPAVNVLKRNGFKFKGSRGKEVLLVKYPRNRRKK